MSYRRSVTIEWRSESKIMGKKDMLTTVPKTDECKHLDDVTFFTVGFVVVVVVVVVVEIT